MSVTNRPEDISAAERLIVPGVGHFGKAVDNLRSAGLFDAVVEFIGAGRPFLGICLGLQLLLEGSEEAPGVRGFGVLGGTCRRFDAPLRVPQIGWNTVRFVRTSPVTEGIPDGSFFYFVHSYYVDAAGREENCGITEYGGAYASLVVKDGIVGCQFHPEKSQNLGLRFLHNFLWRL